LSPSIYSFAVPLSGFHAAAKRHLALALSTFSHLAINDALNLPRYSARDIFVLEKFPGIGYIAKVLANGLEVVLQGWENHTREGCPTGIREFAVNFAV
jgi:hypothetical protein